MSQPAYGIIDLEDDDTCGDAASQTRLEVQQTVSGREQAASCAAFVDHSSTEKIDQGLRRIYEQVQEMKSTLQRIPQLNEIKTCIQETINSQLEGQLTSSAAGRMVGITATPPWETTCQYQPIWKKWLVDFYSPEGRNIDLDHHKDWLELLKHDNAVHFKCRFCAQFVELNKGLLPIGFPVEEFAQANGVTKRLEEMQSDRISWYWNRRFKLREKWSKKTGVHGSRGGGAPLHKFVVEGMRKEWTTLNKMRRGGANVVAEKRRLLMQSTEDMFRTVYWFVKNNIALSKFASYIRHATRLGHLRNVKRHTDRFSANRMMDYISRTMHRNLIRFLKESKTPLSLIVDGSSDSTQNACFMIMLQYVEHHLPVTRIYSVMQVESEESEKLFQYMEDMFTKDGIIGNIGDQLMGFTSDGAANMVGAHKGLRTRIRNWLQGRRRSIETPLFEMHCMAHRFQLAIGKALKGNRRLKSVFDDFVHVINGLHSFYSHYATARMRSLRELAESHNMKVAKPARAIGIRWVSSKYRALLTLGKNYFLCVYHLHAMTTQDDLRKSSGWTFLWRKNI